MPYYLQKLSNEFHERQRRNSAYSLRSFARQLGLSAPVLSEVLRQKRGLPERQMGRVVSSLGLTPQEAQIFKTTAKTWRVGLRGLADVELSKADYKVLDNERDFRIIAEWEYYAVFESLELGDFSQSPAWIAAKLGITESRAKVVLESLISAGLIARTPSGKLVKTAKELDTPQDVQSTALRRSHRESLELASSKMETVPIAKRFFSSSTIAIDRENIPQAKELIREFRQKLAKLLAGNPSNEVYQFCVQLFPLTVPANQKKGKSS